MKKIKSVRIIGGGSAGWMTAAALITHCPDLDIRVIESPKIPTVGVGEATIGQFRQYLDLIGVKDTDFMKASDATYKLSIAFKNFYKKNNETFHYPFCPPDMSGNDSQLNDWVYKKILFPDTPYSDYADSVSSVMALVKENKMSKNIKKTLSQFDFTRDVAFHFDAVKFGQWLRDKFCIPKGVVHVPQELTQWELGENGIETFYLDNQHGNPMKADLFIDCTGFKSMLLGKIMKEPFESYLDILPNNCAWATRLPYKNKEKEIVGWTHCEAIDHGWVWTIPLWSRIGTGYVFSDQYVSHENALKEFQAHLKKERNLNDKEIEKLTFKKIPMRVGIHKNLWVKNVCAIGLSAGFIEPLESNGLFTVHEFIINLIRTLKRGSVSQWDRDVFTSICKSTFKSFAEFVAFHYALSHRDDTDYWKAISNKKLPNTIFNDQITPWTYGFKHIISAKMNHHFFNGIGGYHYVATGMHWLPTDLADQMYQRNSPNYTTQDASAYYKEKWGPIVERLNKKKERWKEAAKKERTLYSFLEQNIYGRSKG